MAASFTTVDEYIALADPRAKPALKKIRALVRKTAPRSVEKISYRIPAFVLEGDLVYFAAFKHHIGFYPPVRDPAVRQLVAKYAGEKGNLRFPLDEPIPYALIAKIVRARMKENAARAAAKKSAKRTALRGKK
jgi:uncharacterized protein YdhG (YjbR/CyaY superfamily)